MFIVQCGGVQKKTLTGLWSKHTILDQLRNPTLIVSIYSETSGEYLALSSQIVTLVVTLYASNYTTFSPKDQIPACRQAGRHKSDEGDRLQKVYSVEFLTAVNTFF